MRRCSAQIVTGFVIGLLGVGLLGVGLLGGCASEPEPATPPTTTATPAPPLPLPRPQPPGGPARPEPGLGTQDLALLAEARRIGAQWVILLVAPAPNSTDEAVAGLEELGGVLGTAGPGGGNLRVTMPTDNVERVVDLPTVTAVDIEQVISPDSARPHG
ncbi:MAG: hypothetical protein ACT4NY_18430 [Pseudonocardiales bacterium]